jgi:hypothetical protein
MGYNTEFQGEFKFNQELTASQLAKVKSFLGEDCRDHPEWNVKDLYYINLELLEDFTGLKWDRTEKTYGMVEALNLIIVQMRVDMPSFNLTGKLLAQGEDIDDRYEIIIRDGVAIRVDIKPTGTKVECPHCGESFYLSGV